MFFVFLACLNDFHEADFQVLSDSIQLSKRTVGPLFFLRLLPLNGVVELIENLDEHFPDFLDRRLGCLSNLVNNCSVILVEFSFFV